jgi:glycosyltransferase involved in cell wall biosynthesis
MWSYMGDVIRMSIQVSVIIPVYNLEKYIGRCIDSVISQTEKNFEVILINDGSQDNSINIINSKIKADSRFKLINQDNRGVSAARNKGLESAVGEYITFVDGDDFIEANMLKEMYNLAKINNLSIVSSNLFAYSNKSYKDKMIISTNEYIIDSRNLYLTACRRFNILRNLHDLIIIKIESR